MLTVSVPYPYTGSWPRELIELIELIVFLTTGQFCFHNISFQTSEKKISKNAYLIYYILTERISFTDITFIKTWWPFNFYFMSVDTIFLIMEYYFFFWSWLHPKFRLIFWKCTQISTYLNRSCIFKYIILIWNNCLNLLRLLNWRKYDDIYSITFWPYIHMKCLALNILKLDGHRLWDV